MEELKRKKKIKGQIYSFAVERIQEAFNQTTTYRNLMKLKDENSISGYWIVGWEQEGLPGMNLGVVMLQFKGEDVGILTVPPTDDIVIWMNSEKESMVYDYMEPFFK